MVQLAGLDNGVNVEVLQTHELEHLSCSLAALGPNTSRPFFEYDVDFFLTQLDRSFGAIDPSSQSIGRFNEGDSVL